jgi:transposase
LHYEKVLLLTDAERDQLLAQHRLERDGRIRDRIKAVLLRDKGWSYQQIASALFLSDDAIRNHIQDYLEARKLKPENGGSDSRLSSQQAEQLEKHLETNTYLHVKSIVRYVKLQWGVDYTVAGMTNWLKRHGFSYKKPKLVPGKANLEEQEKWIAQYEDLRANLPEGETICFIDGTHPSHNVQLGYGWIKKGTEKLVPSNTGRSRINLTGAIDIITHQVVVQEDKTLNAEATISFFKKLERSLPSKAKINVFCDNAPYYRNKDVQDFLADSRIHLHFLPPYSPNLNPIERLWKWMKEVVVYNTYYEEFDDFRSAILGFFKSLSGLDPGSELGRSFRSRIRDKFRAMGAPVLACV